MKFQLAIKAETALVYFGKGEVDPDALAFWGGGGDQGKKGSQRNVNEQKQKAFRKQKKRAAPSHWTL